MWETSWEVLVEAWQEQIALNEDIDQVLEGFQASDAAILRMVQHIEWTTWAIGIVVLALALDRIWQIIQHRIVDWKWEWMSITPSKTSPRLAHHASVAPPQTYRSPRATE